MLKLLTMYILTFLKKIKMKTLHSFGPKDFHKDALLSLKNLNFCKNVANVLGAYMTSLAVQELPAHVQYPLPLPLLWDLLIEFLS